MDKRLNWFILNPIPDLDINISTWKKYAQKRIDMLEVFDRYNPKPFTDISNEKEENLTIGNFLLILAATLSSPMRSWLIEKEGDYFDYRLKISSFQVQIAILSRLLNDNIWSFQDFIAHYNGEYKDSLQRITKPIITFKIFDFPEIINTKSYFLYDEWAITELDYLLPYLKRIFERKLKEQINNFIHHANKNSEIKQTIHEILSYLEQKHIQIQPTDSLNKKINISNIFEKLEVLPPCVRYLATKMNEERYLDDQSRIQLALFLKNIGMNLDEQLDYWWTISADNVGMLRSEWDRIFAPRIEHLYGERGGHINYKSISCSKSASSYFCPFAQLNSKSLISFIENIFGKINNIDIIVKEANYRNYQKACMILWKQINNIKSKKLDRIYSPISWTNLSIKKKENEGK